MKASIDQLKKDAADAKARQAEASKDIKCIEKDMKDFDNNKDTKLAELQCSLNTLRKSQIKNSVSVKALQKELQSSRLEAEQAGADSGAAQEQLAEVESTLTAQEAEVLDLQNEQAQAKVRLEDSSEKLTANRITGCTRYRTSTP
jgi:structural maintenance of chromosome 2